MTILVCGGLWNSVEHKKESSQSESLGTAEIAYSKTIFIIITITIRAH